PSVFDRNPQATEALLEQLLIRQLFPSIFPAWHRHPEVITTRYLNGVIGWMLLATTAESWRRAVVQRPASALGPFALILAGPRHVRWGSSRKSRLSNSAP